MAAKPAFFQFSYGAANDAISLDLPIVDEAVKEEKEPLATKIL